MSGNRAFTIQDVLNQLNDTVFTAFVAQNATGQLNQVTFSNEHVHPADSATATTGASSFDWDAAGAYWGAVVWQ